MREVQARLQMIGWLSIDQEGGLSAAEHDQLLKLGDYVEDVASLVDELWCLVVQHRCG